MANKKLHDAVGTEWRPEDDAHADEIRAGLQRVEAPAGFTDRLLARVALREREAVRCEVGARPGVLLQLSRPVWRAALAAAALLAITAGSLRVEHVRAEHRRADEAAAQLDTALQVTSHALNQVSARLETTEFGTVQRALENNGGAK